MATCPCFLRYILCPSAESLRYGIAQTARQQLRYARQQYALQPKGQEPTRYIPIKLHIVGTDTGAGYFDAIEAYRLICELNEDYIPVGFHFYLVG